MQRIRQRRLERAATADLDVTPFMNLMIVLVPVLLLSMTLPHTRVIELDLPWGAAEPTPDASTVRIEVIVDGNGFIIEDGKGKVISSVPKQASGYDYQTLALVMQELKRELPDKRDVALLLAPDVNYQTLVSVMDSVRSHTGQENGGLVTRELFPEITLGDAAVESTEGLAQTAERTGRRT